MGFYFERKVKRLCEIEINKIMIQIENNEKNKKKEKDKKTKKKEMN